MLIRRAVTEDISPLAQMRYEFRVGLNAESEEREDVAGFVQRCDGWMRAHLDTSNWFCWVAEHEGVIVGNIWLFLWEKLPNPWLDEPEMNGYITNFYVTPAHRGRGIGAKLLAAAVELARDRSVDSVILWATSESRRLYQRAGFAVPIRVLELNVARSEGTDCH
jgi:GNAT superfamily N-acetyltransferase